MSGEEEAVQQSEAYAKESHSTPNGEAIASDVPHPERVKNGRNKPAEENNADEKGAVEKSGDEKSADEKQAEKKPSTNGREPAPTPEMVEEAERAIKREFEASHLVPSEAPRPYYTGFTVFSGVTVIIGSIYGLVYLLKKPKKKTKR